MEKSHCNRDLAEFKQFGEFVYSRTELSPLRYTSAAVKWQNAWLNKLRITATIPVQFVTATT